MYQKLAFCVMSECGARACRWLYARSDDVFDRAVLIPARAVGAFCFFRHSSVRLDCCGGAFFPGGMVINLAVQTVQVDRLPIVVMKVGIPSVCCLDM
jgi:hypothetical protein